MTDIELTRGLMIISCMHELWSPVDLLYWVIGRRCRYNWHLLLHNVLELVQDQNGHIEYTPFMLYSGYLVEIISYVFTP